MGTIEKMFRYIIVAIQKIIRALRSNSLVIVHDYDVELIDNNIPKDLEMTAIGCYEIEMAE
jgi:hypothetical protein